MRAIFSWLDALAVKILIFKKNILKSSANHCVYLQDAERVCSPSLATRRKVIIFLPWCGRESLVTHRGVENYLGGGGDEGGPDKAGRSGETNAKLWARGDGRSPSRSSADLLQTLEANGSFLRASVCPSPKRR